MSAIIMPPASPIEAPAPTTEMPSPYRLSVEQYHAMVEHGLFHPEDRVELIRGILVKKMTKKPPHTISTILVQEVLSRLLPSGWHLRIQEPITLSDSEPEPDGSVIRGSARDYHSGHPGPGDAALVVEVAETSLSFDRTAKKALYAAAGIPTYWIVNVVDNQLEVFTGASGPTTQPDYATTTILGPGDDVALILDGQEVGRFPVAALLP